VFFRKDERKSFIILQWCRSIGCTLQAYYSRWRASPPTRHPSLVAYDIVRYWQVLQQLDGWRQSV
ncbi:MAG: hypothetical protein ABI813_11350, partial [Bacteroidota bacterium]